MGQPPEQVFKTLVTQGASRAYFVFVIPVACELDLKAAARSVGEKSVAMIPVAAINKVTGYIRGGCSPIGMKKPFVTVIHSSCEKLPSMIVSAGRIGLQMELAPADLLKAAKASTASIVMA
jgi:Cys-tRNA(Pro)/Cys-tRNA(Cys) deacylase